jgi:hypothetical protein
MSTHLAHAHLFPWGLTIREMVDLKKWKYTFLKSVPWTHWNKVSSTKLRGTKSVKFPQMVSWNLLKSLSRNNQVTFETLSQCPRFPLSPVQKRKDREDSTFPKISIQGVSCNGMWVAKTKRHKYFISCGLCAYTTH